MAYAVGYLTSSELVKVQEAFDIFLRDVAGRAFLSMSLTYRRETGSNTGLTIYSYGGYRWAALQNAMANNPSHYNVKPGVSVSRHPNGTHETGLCVDIAGSESRSTSVGNWMRSGNALRFGFHADTLAGDPGHWKYISGTSPSGEDVSTIEGFLMALADSQQNEIYAWIKGLAFGDYPAQGQFFEKLNTARVAAINASDTLNKPSPVSTPYKPFDVVISSVKDTNGKVSEPVKIDVDALASAIAAKLPVGITGPSKEEIAQAVRAAIIKD